MAASDMRSFMIVVEATAQIVSHELDILLHHPVCAACILLQIRLKDTKSKLASIQEFFSSQYRPSETTEWLGRLLRAMNYTKEFIDKFHLRQAHEKHKALHIATRPIATLVSKYKLWRDVSILVNKMEELCDEEFLKEDADGKRKKKPASSSSHASVPWQGMKLARLTGFWDRQASTNFSCREAEKKKIMEWMKAERFAGIGIWGERGTGKTFLARWAYSQAKYMGFECRVWVHVSPSMDEQGFLLGILKQVEKLAGDGTDMNVMEIQAKLLQKLAEINKFLIVLDDVQPSDWQEILLELWRRSPHGTQSCIIATTRYESIASFMSYDSQTIKLEKLADYESQRMLAWKLHRALDSQRLSIEEKNILNMCPRLPLCIALLGGFLANAGEQERAALAKEGSTMALPDILQLSCHKLPVHLKPCFIYMALFPVGFPIPTGRLVRLWLAEGLLDSHCYDIERERKRQPEDVGETFILELADRNVIDVVSWRADGSPKACQMLTSLYDMICPIAMSTGFLHIHDRNDCDPTSQQQLPAQLSTSRWLAQHTNIVRDNCGGSYGDLNLGHVHSFLSFYQRRGILTKDISPFLRKMTSDTDYSVLRVLDLEGVYKPFLKGVLRKLVLLRYLGLRSTLLDSIPHEVADLCYLETLDIKHTNIALLPSSLWKVRNLRHLHLNWFYMDLKIFKAVTASTKLQTLSGLVIGEAEENSMTGLMNYFSFWSNENSLTTLTKLKLFLQHSGNGTSDAAGKTVADWISYRLTNLQFLTFGVIQEAQAAEEAQPEAAEEAGAAEEAQPEDAEEAESVEEAGAAEEATKVDKPDKEDKPAKEAMKKTERSEGAKPARSQIGPLPEMSLAERHHDLLELYLLGQLNRPIWRQLLPVSLRVLTLSGSKVETDMMPELGGLLRQLRTFRLLANSFLGSNLTFAKDGFPSLEFLKIWKLPKLEEVIIEEGAMLHLKELELRRLESLKIVEGIKECKELENISVISQSDALAKQLKDRTGEKTNLHIEKKHQEALVPLGTMTKKTGMGQVLNLKHILHTW